MGARNSDIERLNAQIVKLENSDHSKSDIMSGLEIEKTELLAIKNDHIALLKKYALIEEALK